MLSLARAIADSGVPVFLKHVPVDSVLIDILRFAYHGRGMVLIHPEPGGQDVSVSAYPASMRGVSALATDVFHFGFQRLAPRYRLDLAA